MCIYVCTKMLLSRTICTLSLYRERSRSVRESRKHLLRARRGKTYVKNIENVTHNEEQPFKYLREMNFGPQKRHQRKTAREKDQRKTL